MVNSRRKLGQRGLLGRHVQPGHGPEVELAPEQRLFTAWV